MPEITVTDKFVDQIPRFNIREEVAKLNPNPAAPTPEKEQAKPAAEAPATLPETSDLVTKPDEEVEDKETTGKDPEKPSTRRFERRMDRAIRAKAEAQARAEVLERELTELKAKQTPQVVQGAPKMEDFTDVQEYAKAYAQFEKKNAIDEYEKKQRDTVQQASQKKLTDDWEAKVTKAVAKYDDYDEKVGDLKPTQPWSIALMQADNGEEIAYYLGSHPKEAQRIISLDPYSQIREIGKLELKLSQAPEPPKKPSKAPPPIAPVTGTAKVDDDMYAPQSPEEYMKKRNKSLGRR